MIKRDSEFEAKMKLGIYIWQWMLKVTFSYVNDHHLMPDF